MMAWMSPRLWLALGLAMALALSHAFIYRAGKASVRADWDKSIIAQQRAAATAEAENWRLETLRQSRVIEAQNANTKRSQVRQVAVAVRDAGSVGLRNDLAAVRADVSSASVDACRARIATLAAVLADMELEGGRMAARAQGHADDTLTFQEAWPK